AAWVDKDPVRESLMKTLRTKYGVFGDRPCSVEGLRVDPHIQGVRDPDHALQFGVKRLLLQWLYEGMNAFQRECARRRLADFSRPSGFERITFDFTRKIAARYSMEFTAKMFLVA